MPKHETKLAPKKRRVVAAKAKAARKTSRKKASKRG
jgi:hypothetical protein